MAEEKKILLERSDIGRMVHRMAHEIVEKATEPAEIALIGIRSRGVHLARRLARKVEEIVKINPAVGVIDVTPYRDDKSQEQPLPAVGAFEVPVTIEDRTVVLIDDVIYRGRTIRAAMEAVERLGQPKRILVAALIDRGDRELPIRADIVGKNLKVKTGERVNVQLDEADGVDQVILTNWREKTRSI
jgi:pyrimidine operon attenuation protein/uracil phosphoribosyltransferase